MELPLEWLQLPFSHSNTKISTKEEPQLIYITYNVCRHASYKPEARPYACRYVQCQGFPIYKFTLILNKRNSLTLSQGVGALEAISMILFAANKVYFVRQFNLVCLWLTKEQTNVGSITFVSCPQHVASPTQGRQTPVGCLPITHSMTMYRELQYSHHRLMATDWITKRPDLGKLPSL